MTRHHFLSTQCNSCLLQHRLSGLEEGMGTPVLSMPRIELHPITSFEVKKSNSNKQSEEKYNDSLDKHFHHSIEPTNPNNMR